MGLTSPTTSGRADDRLAARRSLIAAGLTAEESAYWCAAWAAEAERQRLRPESRYFWDAGRGWIDAQIWFAAHAVALATNRPLPTPLRPRFLARRNLGRHEATTLGGRPRFPPTKPDCANRLSRPRPVRRRPRRSCSSSALVARQSTASPDPRSPRPSARCPQLRRGAPIG
jgi:hypothetical protein